MSNNIKYLVSKQIYYFFQTSLILIICIILDNYLDLNDNSGQFFFVFLIPFIFLIAFLNRNISIIYFAISLIYTYPNFHIANLIFLTSVFSLISFLLKIIYIKYNNILTSKNWTDFKYSFLILLLLFFISVYLFLFTIGGSMVQTINVLDSSQLSIRLKDTLKLNVVDTINVKFTSNVIKIRRIGYTEQESYNQYILSSYSLKLFDLNFGEDMEILPLKSSTQTLDSNNLNWKFLVKPKTIRPIRLAFSFSKSENGSNQDLVYFESPIRVETTFINWVLFLIKVYYFKLLALLSVFALFIYNMSKIENGPNNPWLSGSYYVFMMLVVIFSLFYISTQMSIIRYVIIVFTLFILFFLSILFYYFNYLNLPSKLKNYE